jgi:hypothetical protein
MKKIILLLSLSVVIASMYELAGAKDKAPQIKETVKDRNIITTTISWCPIVGTARAAEQGFPVLKDENGVEIYHHCEKCSIGVLTLHDDGKTKCTYCGNE